MDVQELRFEVVIDSRLEPVTEQLVTYDAGARDGDRLAWGYGSLRDFYEDLILGAPWPLKLGIHTIRGVDTIVAVALFCGRDLAVQPNTMAFVAATDLYRRFGVAGLAHIPSDVAKFIVLLSSYIPQGLSKEQTGERLTHAVAWVREYLLEDRLPHLGAALANFRVVDLGTNGFVVAECARPSAAAWAEVYRAGFLRGVLFSPDKDARRSVVAARKSRFIELDLGHAVRLLNELERAAGGDPEWQADDFFAWSPGAGTALLPSEILEILLRC